MTRTLSHRCQRFGAVVVLTSGLLLGCGKAGDVQVQDGPPPPKLAVLSIEGGPFFDFGTKLVGDVFDANFVVRNSGDGPATAMASSFNLSLNYSFRDGAYPGTGGSCTTELAPGASCVVVVRFAPQYKGRFQDVLRIRYHDGVSDKITSAPQLTGQGN